VLAALADFGLYVPVQQNGSVLFLKGEDGTPVLPGYVSEACCARWLPQAAAVHCDAPRLLDIAKETGVAILIPHSVVGWARVPIPLLAQTLQQRGRSAAGERLKLSWSTHPVAVALRGALARRIGEFPAVCTAWVAQARWLDTGAENLMLYIAVDEQLPSTSAQALLRTLMSQDVELGSVDPQVGMIALNLSAHASSIAELDTMALDTVRRDPATGRIEVVSREFDVN
jgi:hypothetical protein